MNGSSDDTTDDVLLATHAEDVRAMRSLLDRGCVCSLLNETSSQAEMMRAAGLPIGRRGRLFLSALGGMKFSCKHQKEVKPNASWAQVLASQVSSALEYPLNAAIEFAMKYVSPAPISPPPVDTSPFASDPYFWELAFDAGVVIHKLGPDDPQYTLFDVSYSVRKLLSVVGVSYWGELLFLSEEDDEVFVFDIEGKDVLVIKNLSDAVEAFFFTRQWDLFPSIERVLAPDPFRWPDDVHSGRYDP